VIKLANAPCSWGVLEFESRSASPGYAQVLDEIAQSGYAGTELGDWGFMPSDPALLREELARRQLALVGAFVTTRLSDPQAYEDTRQRAVATARLMTGAGNGGGWGPVIVLSDEPMADLVRARAAGRVQGSMSLTERQWDEAAGLVERIARAVHDEAGLRTVFHHHCATFVETPQEIEALLLRTDPALVGLCLDSGHATYGGGSPAKLLSRYQSRTWHVHFKDCEPGVVRRARAEEWDYQTALGRGLFCELGQGAVDFPGLLGDLERAGYEGWIVVEQDVLPSMGAPLESAIRNRQYLRQVGI
jgi:inosose dehydratase